MRQKITLINLVLLLILAFSQNVFAEVKYEKYINNSCYYEIIIPQVWKKDESAEPGKHFFTVKNENAEIKVRAIQALKDDMDKILHSETWDLRKIDPALSKIIETEKITIKKNVSGKLLIFEYRSKKDNILQRTLITQKNSLIYIIQCKAPQKIFYKYDDIFNTAFASFKFTLAAKTSPEITEEQKKEQSETGEENIQKEEPEKEDQPDSPEEEQI